MSHGGSQPTPVTAAATIASSRSWHMATTTSYTGPTTQRSTFTSLWNALTHVSLQAWPASQSYSSFKLVEEVCYRKNGDRWNVPTILEKQDTGVQREASEDEADVRLRNIGTTSKFIICDDIILNFQRFVGNWTGFWKEQVKSIFF